MLADGTRITTHPNGTTVPIQDLLPGDQVYSPLTDSMHLIVDILSRSAEFDPRRKDLSEDLLQPVRLRRGSLSGARPLEDLITSPAQQIFLSRRSHRGTTGLELARCADQIEAGKAKYEECSSIRYFAIFTDSDCAICANECLVRSYNSKWLAADGARTAMFGKRPVSDARAPQLAPLC
ncbi:Hint domain-containing protein [Oceaniglobus trochenteri]|uniref:Hint domain-containing protein n=1 Tax=Oceaniglobus trochenteri TaxID=2763260 RepID=UPI001CFF8C28|nr:Hint domain-containing protein [Oceaniglobus trochenteri]